MITTLFVGALTPLVGISTMISALATSIIYELMRRKFNLLTFGEHLINSADKNKILIQTKKFSISRIPLFVLMLLTLAISGNMLDGLSEGQVYSVDNVLLFGLLTGCLYYGMKNFMNNPELLPIFLIMTGLVLTGFAFQYSSKAQLTENFILNLYLGLSAIWLVTGLIYKTKVLKY